MIHDRQRLTLGLEPRDDLLGVHAGLDDLEGHPAPDRFLLLGHVDGAHAAFADLLKQPVWADKRADACGKRRTLAFFCAGLAGLGDRLGGGLLTGLAREWFEEAAGLLVGAEECFDRPAAFGITPTCFLQVGRSLRSGGPLKRLGKQRLQFFWVHGRQLVSGPFAFRKNPCSAPNGTSGNSHSIEVWIGR